MNAIDIMSVHSVKVFQTSIIEYIQSNNCLFCYTRMWIFDDKIVNTTDHKILLFAVS
jgi:hypothetical protein